MSQPNSASDAFNDSLDFVKKLWGQMGVPGMQSGAGSMPGMTGMPGMSSMALPSMSVEDLDQRISDLKTVETWLNLNLQMLRNTIQALEVQRATIATLQSLSSTMANTMQGFTESVGAKSAAPDDDVSADTEPASPLIAQSAAWWQGVQDQFKQALGAALEGAATTSAPKSTAAPAKPKAPSAKKPASKTAASKRASPASSRSKSKAKPATKSTAKRGPF